MTSQIDHRLNTEVFGLLSYKRQTECGNILATSNVPIEVFDKFEIVYNSYKLSMKFFNKNKVPIISGVVITGLTIYSVKKYIAHIQRKRVQHIINELRKMREEENEQ